MAYHEVIFPVHKSRSARRCEFSNQCILHSSQDLVAGLHLLECTLNDQNEHEFVDPLYGNLFQFLSFAVNQYRIGTPRTTDPIWTR